jgi:hypothetical protein
MWNSYLWLSDSGRGVRAFANIVRLSVKDREKGMKKEVMKKA